MKTQSQKQLIEELHAAGCSDREIAGTLGLTLTELSALVGRIIQDDPDWSLRMDCAKSLPTALAKRKLLRSLRRELDADELESRDSKYVLDRRSPEYNPKMDITSGLQPVTGFTITPPSPPSSE